MTFSLSKRVKMTRKARRTEADAGLRILARMIARAYLNQISGEQHLEPTTEDKQVAGQAGERDISSTRSLLEPLSSRQIKDGGQVR